MNSSKKYKPRLVVFLSRFPYPIEKGDKLRAFNQIQSLAKEFEIFLICTNQDEVKTSDIEKLKPFCKEIHYFILKKHLIFLNLLFALFNKKPFQVAYFTQKWIKQKVNAILETINPNHIYCQLIRPAEYVKNYHSSNKSIDIMDALSIGMERRSKTSNFFKRLFFQEEAKRLKNYERQILNYFEKSFVISQQDKNYLLHPKDKEIIVLPNGVNENFYSCELVFEKNYDLVFTGNMSYPPNINASNYIIQKIYPDLIKIYPKLKILLSGSKPSSRISRKHPKNIFISGWVDDIRESYLKSEIFIAPLFSGTGMQNKILEAMALGIPCITTSLVNNAILAENKKNILIADTQTELIHAIIELKSNSDFYKNISENGKKFILNNYTWKSVNRILISNLTSD